MGIFQCVFCHLSQQKVTQLMTGALLRHDLEHNTVHALMTSLSHLFKECHGKLLVRDAVSGCANVFFGLICNVEVNPHQDVFLQKHREHK